LLDDVEAFCQEIRPIEELCYVEYRFNEEVLPLARKYNLLGMPVPVEYGGRGVATVTYARALARIGREGTGVRTFFSGHTSIGEYPILTWGSEDQKRRYLPPACRGDKVLAFGLTEPEAGSNPLEMTSTYERRGDHFVLDGDKYLISNGGIAQAIVTFAYPKNATGRARRISAFVLDTDVPGFEVESFTPQAKAGAELLAAQAKLFAANAAWDAADRAVQVYGGRGWSTLYRVGRHLMDVRVCRIYEGTDEILKLKIAAAVLGKDFEAYQ